VNQAARFVTTTSFTKVCDSSVKLNRAMSAPVLAS
jgi:hypothetical protein